MDKLNLRIWWIIPCVLSIGCASYDSKLGLPDVGGSLGSANGDCIATTCAAEGKDCGSLLNGCGLTIDCGNCSANPPGWSCGGGGEDNVCGCPATTCEAEGKNCGLMPDGCGADLDCGTCEDGQECGGSGMANVCGEGTCEPIACEDESATCGMISDGCEGTLDCGPCMDCVPGEQRLCGECGVTHCDTDGTWSNDCLANPTLYPCDEEGETCNLETAQCEIDSTACEPGTPRQCEDCGVQYCTFQRTWPMDCTPAPSVYPCAAGECGDDARCMSGGGEAGGIDIVAPVGGVGGDAEVDAGGAAADAGGAAVDAGGAEVDAGGVEVGAGGSVDPCADPCAAGCPNADVCGECGNPACCALIRPILQSPISFAGVDPGDIDFSWSAVPGATRYDLEVRTEADVMVASASVTVASLTLTSAYTVAGTPLPSGNYLWAVTARDDTCSAVGADGGAFTVRVAGCEPADACGQCGNAPCCTGPFACDAGCPNADACGLCGNPACCTGPYACDAGCPNADACGQCGNPACCPLTPPILQSPTSTAIAPAVDIAFNWSSVNGATNYALEVKTVSGQVVASASTANAQFTLTSAHIAGRDYLLPGEYIWTVTATDGTCAETGTLGGVFTVTCAGPNECEAGCPNADDCGECGNPACCTLAPPTLQAPINLASAAAVDIRFDWSSVPGALFYDLEVKDVNGQVVAAASTANPPFTLARLHMIDREHLSPGEYIWTVTANAGTCSARGSQGGVFEVRACMGANACNVGCPNALAAPTLQEPINIAPTAEVGIRFDWSTVSGATRYDLEVKTVSGQVVAVASTINPPLVLTSEHVVDGDHLLPREYIWTVTATTGTCSATGGGGGVFEVRPCTGGNACSIDCPNVVAAPTLESPISLEVVEDVDIEFTWSAVAGAESYRFQVKNESGDVVAIILDASALITTSFSGEEDDEIGSSSLTLTSDYMVGNFLGPGTYTWSITVGNGSCTATGENGGSFTVLDDFFDDFEDL